MLTNRKEGIAMPQELSRTTLKVEVSNLLYAEFHKAAVETAMRERLLELLDGETKAAAAYAFHKQQHQPPYSSWNIMFNQAAHDTMTLIGLRPIEHPLYKITFEDTPQEATKDENLASTKEISGQALRY